MSKDPAFLFYSQDFYIGTLEFTHEEVGQYLRMLLLRHQKGRMSNKTMCLLVGNISEKVLSKFKTDEDGNLYNERFETEILKRSTYTKSRRDNGLKGGRPKSTPNPSANHMDNHVGNKDKDKDRNKNEVAIKEGVPKECFDLAETLRSKILLHSPDARIPDSWIDGWALEADRINRIDKRGFDEISEKMILVFNDKFWSGVIRSMGSLRKKWNEGKLNGRGGGMTPQQISDHIDKEMEGIDE